MKKARISGSQAKKQPGIRMVAEEARVSVSTVSRVVNGQANVAPELTRRVRAVVERTGYRASPQALALVLGRSRLFGLLISDITNPFFPELVQRFEEKAAKHGYETLIGSTHRDQVRVELCVQRMIERRVEGVAVMTFGIKLPTLRRLKLQAIPIVTIGTPSSGERSAAIQVDYAKGIRKGVAHLRSLGHLRIAFIAGPRRLESARAREDAFRAEMRAAGMRLREEYVYAGDHSLETGTKGAGKLLSLKQAPTAIMCSNDLTALGVMHAAFAAGVHIPRQLSVIGFDDIHFARYTVPPLTSVRMSACELAEMAINLLLREVGRLPLAEVTTLKTTLTVRQSTGPVLA